MRFGDTDPYGVVYFASYFRYAHQALEDFLTHNGIRPGEVFRNRDRNLGLPIVASSGEFKVPLFYGDEFRISIHPTKIGTSSIIFLCKFWKDKKVVGKVELVMVAIDKNWKPRRLPPELEALEVEID